MGYNAERRPRRARVALLIGVLTAVGIAPQAIARAPDEPPLPTDVSEAWAPFEFAQRQGDGPVIKGSTASTDIDDAVAAAQVTAASNPALTGRFGAQAAWPLVPLHAVLTPDGRVLTYGTDQAGQQTGYYDYDVWDPRLGTGAASHQTLPNETGTDLFCSAQIVLPDGNVELYGGDINGPGNQYNRDVNQFQPATNQLVRTGQMFLKRWYATSTVMPNGEVLIQGGWGQGYDFSTDPVSIIEYPEVRQTDGTFRELRGAITNGVSSYYPRNFVGPDGLVFGISDAKMYRLDPAGSGSITQLGTFPGANRGSSSTAVMFRPGKILQAGGGTDNYNGSLEASVININNGTPEVTALPQTHSKRHWGTGTVMADGSVLLSGGSKSNNQTTDVAYTAEIYHPDTNTWSTAATATRMRLYHSTSLLLPDATVITMGGGTPGPETNLNAEIYYPPYLFKADGSPAARPTISAATTATLPGRTLTVNTPQAGSIQRVALVKMGSVTHSFDMDQRFIDLPFTRSGNQLSAALPSNAYETPPGYYHVFIINAAGVPSVSRTVKIGVDSNLIVNSGFERNPVTAGHNGNVKPLHGWTNGTRAVEVWRGFNGYTAQSGTSNVELDYKGANNRLEQTVHTEDGQQYTLSFWMSARPGGAKASNRFDVYWNGTKVATPAPAGVGRTQTSWLYRSFTVTGTGNDRVSFREYDAGSAGALLDNVRLVPT